MRVLGIDPGIGRTGWGIVEEAAQSKIKTLGYGCIETKVRGELAERIKAVFESVDLLIREHKPQAVAVEELFFNTNVTTAFAVGQARGVVLLAAAQHNLPVFSYTPVQVKVAVAGYGKAEKAQVGKMVKTILGLATVPKPDDTADALAVGITYLFSYKMQGHKQ